MRTEARLEGLLHRTDEDRLRACSGEVSREPADAETAGRGRTTFTEKRTKQKASTHKASYSAKKVKFLLGGKTISIDRTKPFEATYPGSPASEKLSVIARISVILRKATATDSTRTPKAADDRGRGEVRVGLNDRSGGGDEVGSVAMRGCALPTGGGLCVAGECAGRRRTGHRREAALRGLRRAGDQQRWDLRQTDRRLHSQGRPLHFLPRRRKDGTRRGPDERLLASIADHGSGGSTAGKAANQRPAQPPCSAACR